MLGFSIFKPDSKTTNEHKLAQYLVSQKVYTILSDAVLDLDGDRITWTSVLVGGSALPTGLSFDSVTRALNGIPAAGVYNIIMISSDGHGGSVNQTISLRVNTQPATVSTPWQLTTLPVGGWFETELPVDFMIDADGDTLSYALVRTNPEYLVPSWLSFNGTALVCSPTMNDHLATTIQFKGEDGFGGEAYRLVSISIPNSAPVVNRVLGNITVYPGELKTYIVPRDAVFDADGDELTFTAKQLEGTLLPTWATHIAGINSFNLAPISGDQGNYTFVLSATDAQGASVQTQFVSVLFQHDAHAALSLVYCACDERMVINSASEGIE